MSLQALAPSFPSPSGFQVNALSVEEVRQLSQILNRLGVTQAAPSIGFGTLITDPAGASSVQSSLDRAKAIFDSRRRRTGFFPKLMLGETGWEILLVLYIHDGLTRLCIRDLGPLIDSPATTVLRWLKVLKDEDFISLRKHPNDRRVTILDLTDLGRKRFQAYLDAAVI